MVSRAAPRKKGPPRYADALSPAEIEALEAEIDAAFEAVPMPAPDRWHATWAVCLVSQIFALFTLEEFARGTPGGRVESAAFLTVLDRSKYMLRHALDRCRRLPNRITAPVVNDEALWDRAYALQDAAFCYADASRLLASTYVTGRAIRSDAKRSAMSPVVDPREGQYFSLEYLLHTDSTEAIAIPHLVAIFGEQIGIVPETGRVLGWTPQVSGIVERVRRKGDRLIYQVITALARPFVEIAATGMAFDDPDWRFPWGDTAEARGYVSALMGLATYHLVAVYFGARRLGMTGQDHVQICHVTDADRLNADIERLSGLSAVVVARFTRALTFGEGTRTPDPALQPLIPQGDGQLACPWALIVSSNWPRNLLALHTRVDPDGFGAASSVFERRMIAALLPLTKQRYRSRAQLSVTLRGGREEIDLVLVDAERKEILLCELRWMLQPGDVREVHHRAKAAKEKVFQLERKLAAVRDDPQSLYERLGLTHGGWRIDGMVLLDGFGGAPSPLPKAIPIVPRDIFVKALTIAPTLSHLHALFTTPLWLPRDGVDFRSSREPVMMLGVLFDRPGFEIGAQAYMTESLPAYLAEAVALPVEALRAMPWERVP